MRRHRPPDTQAATLAAVHQRRRGLTLVEVLVAILVFATGALGLAATAAAITRQLASNTLRARAVSVARSRAELAHGLGCGALSGGSERAFGVLSEWSVAPGPRSTTLEQTVTRDDAHGRHVDRFTTAVGCQ